MPLPAVLTLVPVHVKVLHNDDDGTPSAGDVFFDMPHVLRDAAGGVVLGRRRFRAKLNPATGEATVNLPATNDPDLSPQGWTYTVTPVTDAWTEAPFEIEVPYNHVGTLELASVAPAVTPTTVATYSLLGHGHSVAQITGLAAELVDLDDRLADLEDAASGNTSLQLLTGPLYSPEDYGNPVGDGVADDYAPVLAAWNAMLANPFGVGRLLIPFGKTYRVDLSNTARVPVSADEARAAFALPQVSRTAPKRAYGIVSAGEAYVVRTAELGGTPTQVNTAGVLFFDSGNTVYTWSPTTGLPCAIGGPDADATDPSGNSFSNIHFSIENVIIRSSDNPSLCAVNLEQISTCRIDRVRFDVESVLDLVVEPTHPTGAALLLPRSNNNVSITLDRLITEGYYAGVPLTEHIELRTAITLRCKVGVFTRRLCSHYGKVHHLKVEQCPNGFSGWDPSGEGPDGGVVPIHGWTGHIDFVDIEDYAYNGLVPWIYAPTAGVHINDPDGRFQGQIGFLGRINSEPAAPTGIGIGPGGGSSSLYVRGPSGTTTSPIAIFGFHHDQDANRFLPPGDTPVTTYRLFPAEAGPSSSATEGLAINVGVVLDFDVDVLATKLHFYRPATNLTGPVTGRIWRVTDQTAVAGSDVTFTFDTETGWIEVEFTDAVALSAAHRYIATVHFPDRYPREGSYWDSGAGGGGIIAGPMTAFSANDSAGGQGRFSMGAITVFPGGNGNGAGYGVDLTVVEA
ncbi:DUF4082 domain-containing protein [Lentzea sp. NBRC 102530]|uniref:DUF4082 domain-containing protein n=1 Tax=Lentzea sp. NBRC 102530 TaxID=3032201 RepID=UPI0024A2C70B|nr:DUF4082 domain-containing protein [Lentzea sp. NBRC 102530]GLY55180.1 hypothetical protein Lesp01_88350 [Lentzea sp. NBRC 102530]